MIFNRTDSDASLSLSTSLAPRDSSVARGRKDGEGRTRKSSTAFALVILTSQITSVEAMEPLLLRFC